MIFSFLSALGGVGLFLLGMLMLTEGLKTLAGTRMREVLARFTATPLSGATTGALTTAAIQSSSATTVTAVGFVASGLLTFPQALGIIFGANIGTTLTGWFVAILGFQLDLGELVLPLVFVGALLRLAARGRVAMLGQALAGFCLLFIGIDYMKDGMTAFQGVVTPTDFPADTLFGRLQMVAIGVLITLVTQSSSAGVATALAALGAGAINFPQAAALVIGMDVGTTFTAVLATVGGGTMAKRTGFAHVIYNVLTGLMAFLLVGPFTALVSPTLGAGNQQVALVAFHSLFNFLGVILVLPFTKPFARLVEALVPEKGHALTKSLDPVVLRDPKAAVELAITAVDQLSRAVTDHLCAEIGTSPPIAEETYASQELEKALSQTRDFLDQIKIPADSKELSEKSKGMFHALDHLERLLYRSNQAERIAALEEDRQLLRLKRLLASTALQHARPENPEACENLLDRLRRLMRRQRKVRRDKIVSDAVTGAISDEDALIRLDALRWLQRVSYHLWRIRLHLNALEEDSKPVTSPKEDAKLKSAFD